MEKKKKVFDFLAAIVKGKTLGENSIKIVIHLLNQAQGSCGDFSAVNCCWIVRSM